MIQAILIGGPHDGKRLEVEHAFPILRMPVPFVINPSAAQPEPADLLRAPLEASYRREGRPIAPELPLDQEIFRYHYES